MIRVIEHSEYKKEMLNRKVGEYIIRKSCRNCGSLIALAISKGERVFDTLLKDKQVNKLNCPNCGCEAFQRYAGE